MLGSHDKPFGKYKFKMYQNCFIFLYNISSANANPGTNIRLDTVKAFNVDSLRETHQIDLINQI